ncbi:MAG: thioredoxin domain-containing protein [Gallionella sp.]|nr:thioredoxin domain-containing protein [Gallionella sp.]
MPNHLARETSPYLLQHADNPVDWHPWNAESLALAKQQGKPILLSIGYSACHWCHVMAHESFEDEEVAAMMNRHFINIKVDREERPDLDQIYQNAHYLLAQRGGGWPLTMFLSPDGTPFYSGTYFPRHARYGLPGFTELLLRLAAAYAENPEELSAQGRELIAALADWQPEKSADDVVPDATPIETALQQLGRNFDRVYGGFGAAPKFPHPAELDFLLRQSHARQDKQARHVALFTLQQMALGGLYDQLGGGFCRYSVDERWDIPHFEKMLYDNGLLLGLYGDAWLVSNDPLFARVAEQTAGWVMREMQSPHGRGANSTLDDKERHARSPHPNPLPEKTPHLNPLPPTGEEANVKGNLQSLGEGANESLREVNVGRGYYASLDADSEHEEGKFYVWQREEAGALLSPEEYAVAALYYGLDDAPNFEHHAWHLRVAQPVNNIAQRLEISHEQAVMRLAAVQAKLFAARERRIRPGRDEKILGSWNGLMIAGMAKAARVFRRNDWLHSAQRAMDFVSGTLWCDGKLLATHKDGKTHLNAYLDDHAFLLNAALELLQTVFRKTDFDFAVRLADALLARFEDTQNGGFFFTSHDHEALIQRNKTGQDNATPSGNGIAAQGLLRLAVLSGDTRYAQAAERCLHLFFPAMRQAASQFSSLCSALSEMLQPPSLLVLCGEEKETAAWRAAVAAKYRPELMIIALMGDEAGLPPPLDKPRASVTTAWLCRGTQCLPPVTSLEKLLAQLA